MPSSSKLARLLFGLLAYVSLGIGLIAIVVPGLPTTEFILLAAWAATRSSPRLSAWLENHRLFGPILIQLAQRQDHRAPGQGQRHRQHAAVRHADAGDARSWLADLPGDGGMSLGNLWIWSRPKHCRNPPESNRCFSCFLRFSVHFPAQTFSATVRRHRLMQCPRRCGLNALNGFGESSRPGLIANTSSIREFALCSTLSIRLKIVLLSGLCLLGVVALIEGMNVYQTNQNNALVSSSSSQMLTTSVQDLLQAKAAEQAVRVQKTFGESLTVVTALADQIKDMRNLAAKRSLEPVPCAKN
jgi:hypothetical protein